MSSEQSEREAQQVQVAIEQEQVQECSKEPIEKRVDKSSVEYLGEGPLIKVLLY